MAEIDLSYKKGARQAYYDIEVLPDLFTLFIMTDGFVRLVILSDPSYSSVTDDELISSFDEFMSNPLVIERCGENAQFELHRFYEGQDLIGFRSILNRVVSCQSQKEWDTRTRFTEYLGWNSGRYDLPMIVAALVLAQNGREHVCADVRRVSDTLIGFDGPPWKMLNALSSKIEMILSGDDDGDEVDLESYPTNRAFDSRLRMADWSDGHIDIAAIMKSAEDDSKFPPGLKKEMARFGLDIVIDENVSASGRITDEEFIQLCLYNGNDVIGTSKIAQNVIVKASIQTRDVVRELYPYTAARAFDVSGRMNIPKRDATAAQLAGLVLIGENRSKPKDIPAVAYDFPLANGEIVDLLEFMREHEDFMPDYIYRFFAHFRGKDTTTKRDNWLAKTSQPITHDATMSCPYYRDGKPVNSYIQVSTGGAHGSVMAGLSKMDPKQIDGWIRSNVGALDDEKPTIDITDVIHIDWSSFYPVMSSKMKMYVTADNVDRYTGVIEKRIEIKESLPEREDEWTQEHYDMQEFQMGLKFILNNATGAGNMHQKYALLPLDNATLSMRLIGNMHIWCLAQRMTQAGAYIVSTNTDGIYVHGISLEKAQEVVHGYVDTYGMEVEPEVITRFINRDTSNRIEYRTGGKKPKVNGRLRHGATMHYTDDSAGRNVPYPLVAAHAAIKYFDDPDWLTTDYDRHRLETIVQELFEESTTPEAWYQIHVGSGSRVLTVDGKRMGRINRVVLTREGSELGVDVLRAPNKQECIEILKSEYSLKDTLDEMGLSTNLELTDDHELVTIVVQKRRFEDDVVYNDGRVNEYRYLAREGSDLTVKLGVEYGDELHVLKVWKKGSITGYTSHTGEVLNLSSELQSFDMSKLDLKAYVDWAESLLEGWKKTADIPEVGLVSRDDTVVEKKISRKVSKKDREIMKLIRLYEVLKETEE